MVKNINKHTDNYIRRKNTPKSFKKHHGLIQVIIAK